MTPEYAAPEQVRGAAVTTRTDVYQLGAVLYELLAGQTPFGGRARTIHELERAALECEPTPLSGALHRDLNAIVLKALRKAPEDRYDSAQDLAQDIRRYLADHPVQARRQTLWYRTSRLAARRRFQFAATAVFAPTLAATFWVAWPRGADPEPSVVVLPFENLSADPANDYFGNGLTDEIITRLSAIEGLKVISRTSAMHYRESTKSLRQIAGELKVAHVVEGSVRQSDGRLRITAQLIDGRDDKHLWAENYDYDLKDVFRVQEEIAWEVVRALEVKLGERERRLLVRQGTRDPEAYQLYRRGRSLWSLRTKESHEQALEYYRRAIERDSSYADPYAGIADAYLTAYQHNLSSLSAAEAYSRLKWAAERALALDDESADAHASFAITLWWQRNWPGAERELRRTLELNPGHGARGWLSLLLAGLGRSEEALREARRINERDPFVATARDVYGQQCYLARKYDCAIEQYRRSLEIDPSWANAYAGLGLAYARTGQSNDAISVVKKAVELGPQRTDFLADLAYVHALAGHRQDALGILDRAKRQPREGFSIARAYVALGEPDSAFAWLERSSWQWPHRAVRSDPALDPLRSDPRFTELSARIEREMGLQ
jgi:TolB-like protein/Tfp pilus assembly protein PilF